MVAGDHDHHQHQDLLSPLSRCVFTHGNYSSRSPPTKSVQKGLRKAASQVRFPQKWVQRCWLEGGAQRSPDQETRLLITADCIMSHVPQLLPISISLSKLWKGPKQENNLITKASFFLKTKAYNERDRWLACVVCMYWMKILLWWTIKI